MSTLGKCDGLGSSLEDMEKCGVMFWASVIHGKIIDLFKVDDGIKMLAKNYLLAYGHCFLDGASHNQEFLR